MTKQDSIPVCPNCGQLVSAGSTMPSAATMAQSPRAVNPISGVFTCFKCNYYGLPIYVKPGEHKNISFANKRINSLDSEATGNRMMRQEFAIGVILFGVSIVFLYLGAIFTWLVTIGLGLGLMLYSLITPRDRYKR